MNLSGKFTHFQVENIFSFDFSTDFHWKANPPKQQNPDNNMTESKSTTSTMTVAPALSSDIHFHTESERDEYLRDLWACQETCSYSREPFPHHRHTCPHGNYKTTGWSPCSRHYGVLMLMRLLLQSTRRDREGVQHNEMLDATVHVLPHCTDIDPTKKQVIIQVTYHGKPHLVRIDPFDTSISICGPSLMHSIGIHNEGEFYALFYKCLSRFCEPNELWNMYRKHSDRMHKPLHKEDPLALDEIGSEPMVEDADTKTSESKDKKPRTRPLVLRLVEALNTAPGYFAMVAKQMNRYGFTENAKTLADLKHARLDHFYQEPEAIVVMFFAVFDKWSQSA
jgi:hypothetical protein